MPVVAAMVAAIMEAAATAGCITAAVTIPPATVDSMLAASGHLIAAVTIPTRTQATITGVTNSFLRKCSKTVAVSASPIADSPSRMRWIPGATALLGPDEQPQISAVQG
jgi:hypothetical protein